MALRSAVVLLVCLAAIGGVVLALGITPTEQLDGAVGTPAEDDEIPSPTPDAETPTPSETQTPTPDAETPTPTPTPDETPTPTPDETETPTPGDAETPDDDPAETGAVEDDGDAEFAFEVVSVEECGSTCRDVTAALHNEGDGDAENVVVETELYAEDNLLWSSEESIGTLSAGDTYDSTERVSLGLGDAAAVQQSGGQVTVAVTVTHDDGEERFERDRTVT